MTSRSSEKRIVPFNIQIIGIGAQLQNGKSIAANYLIDRINELNHYDQIPGPKGTGRWSRSKISYPVKRIAALLLGEEMEWIEANKDGPPPPGWNWSVRSLLEYIGIGVSEAAPGKLISLALDKSPTHVICDDVRRRIELEIIKERKGHTVLMWRPGKENNSPAKTEKELWPLIKKHIEAYKETKQDGAMKVHPLVDFFIVNDGSVKDLNRKLNDLVIKGIFGKLKKRDYSSFASP